MIWAVLQEAYLYLLFSIMKMENVDALSLCDRSRLRPFELVACVFFFFFFSSFFFSPVQHKVVIFILPIQFTSSLAGHLLLYDEAGWAAGLGAITSC
jgi:hypothetical protein